MPAASVAASAARAGTEVASDARLFDGVRVVGAEAGREPHGRRHHRAVDHRPEVDETVEDGPAGTEADGVVEHRGLEAEQPVRPTRRGAFLAEASGPLQVAFGESDPRRDAMEQSTGEPRRVVGSADELAGARRCPPARRAW
jgi:hypothetical protein